MHIKTFIKDFVQNTKGYIEKYEQYKELSGEDKKKRVDVLITDYVQAVIDNVGMNFVFKFVLKKLLLENIPTITQLIFDLIKTKVDGITKWE